MSEFYDDLITDALEDFRTVEANTPGLLPGTAAVRATVKRRRAVRVTTLSVVGAILIAAPIAAFAASPHSNTPPTPAGSGAATPVESASPSPSPSSSQTTAAMPDGRITLEQLTSTDVDIPAFGDACPASHVRLTTTAGATQAVVVAKIIYTNLDDDPSLDTAALLLCEGVSQAPPSQVVAFDRDATGKIRTLGQVVGLGYKLNVRDITVRPQGGIIADVSDIVACCDTPVSREQHQNREYAWDGTKFAQVGGPTVYGDPRYVTDLQVVVTDVTLGPPAAGKRSGTATVTVKNNGPSPSGRFQVGFGNCTFSCASGIPFWAWGTYGTYHAPLASGESTTTTINLNFDANTPGGNIQASLTVVGRDNDKEISDLNPTNNSYVFHVKLG
jgi:hypothetical protein